MRTPMGESSQQGYQFTSRLELKRDNPRARGKWRGLRSSMGGGEGTHARVIGVCEDRRLRTLVRNERLWIRNRPNALGSRGKRGWGSDALIGG